MAAPHHHSLHPSRCCGAPLQSPHRCPRAARRQQQGAAPPAPARRRRCTARAGGSSGPGTDGPAGDGEVQDALVDMIQMEVAKAKIKQGILDDLEVRKEGMRLIGQELTEEFEKKVELDKMRMDLASSSTLADALAQFQELDDEIQGIRDQLRADQQDLAAFEARSASQRNSSLFFKQLYQGPADKGGAEGGAGAAAAAAQRQQEASLVDPQVVARLSDNVKAPAAQEVRSPLRLYISTYLSLVLLGVMASDAVPAAPPKLALDALYAALAAGLGWNAWNERQAIITSAPPRDEGSPEDRQR